MAADFAASSIVLPFGDGEYLFRLGLVQLAELQTKCDAGLGRIFARVAKGRHLLNNGSTIGNPEEAEWIVADLYETVRLGLIGGGEGTVNGAVVKVTPLLAKQLADSYVVARPWKEAWTVAAAVLMACVEGYHPPAETPAKKAPPAKTREAASTSPAR